MYEMMGYTTPAPAAPAAASSGTSFDWGAAGNVLIGGLSRLLDRPSEGVTPSVLPYYGSDGYTERHAPVNGVPYQTMGGTGQGLTWGGGGLSLTHPLVLLGGAVAAFVLVKLVR